MAAAIASDETAKLNIRTDYSVCSSLHGHISEEIPAVDIDGKTKQRTLLCFGHASGDATLRQRWHDFGFETPYSTKCIHKTI